jgi:hypothetical protein
MRWSCALRETKLSSDLKHKHSVVKRYMENLMYVGYQFNGILCVKF